MKWNETKWNKTCIEQREVLLTCTVAVSTHTDTIHIYFCIPDFTTSAFKEATPSPKDVIHAVHENLGKVKVNGLQAKITSNNIIHVENWK